MLAIAARFFSPPGRRWPEGLDEGVTLPDFGELAPSSRCRDLLPGGEKKQVASARSNAMNSALLNQYLIKITQTVEEIRLSVATTGK